MIDRPFPLLYFRLSVAGRVAEAEASVRIDEPGFAAAFR
jgi:hypothetical protein